jgi:diguanylate cyclase (GGDEF)-like protein
LEATLLRERRRHRLLAGVALLYVLACTLMQATPDWWPASLVALLATGQPVQWLRWTAVFVVAMALVRQWRTVLREPLAFLLGALFLGALASLLHYWSLAAGAAYPMLPGVQKLVLLLGYGCMTGAVLTLPARVDAAQDPLVITLDSLLVAIAGVLLISLYFILPGGDDSIRGEAAQGLLIWLQTDASPLFDVLLLLVLLAKPRAGKTGALQGVFGGIAVGMSLVLLGDTFVMLKRYFAPETFTFLGSLFHRSAVVAFLYAGLRSLPPLAEWKPARPVPVGRRLWALSSLGTVLLLVALVVEGLDHGHPHLILLSVGVVLSGLLLLTRQALLQRRRNLSTAAQRRELERQVAERTAELAAAMARLELLANEDPLTLLPNRRVFDESLSAAWSACARAGQPLSVALLDIDLFKAYNDHYGHPAGDACLQQVANILRRVVRRRTDLVARYGGEEFLLLLPQTDAAGAALFAERVRAAIEEAALPHAASTVADCVTVSIGVVTAQPDAVSLPERLFFAADAALYEAKADGRNCVRAGKG